MNHEEYWKKEMKKCEKSPYYFFTNYITVNNRKFETFLKEKEFNEMIKKWLKNQK
jgi:hypothetical protein